MSRPRDKGAEATAEEGAVERGEASGDDVGGCPVDACPNCCTTGLKLLGGVGQWTRRSTSGTHATDVLVDDSGNNDLHVHTSLSPQVSVW